MSVEAISWALNLAPVPADRNGQPSSACKFVLVGLANHAGPDGTSAFPSVRTLIRYTGLSERTVRTCLDRLQHGGLIRPCDPAVVAAKIKRADRRPQGWDLNLALIRADFDEAEMRSLEYQFPGLRARVLAAQSAADGSPLGEVQLLHPGGWVANSGGAVKRLHLAADAGCNECSDGVQAPTPPGAAVAPEPLEEQSIETSAAPRGHQLRACLPTALGGGGTLEFFAGLGDEWRLTPSQRARLSPVVEAAINSGWDPQDLAAWTRTNTAGIRNPYAVLTARLSPAALPAPYPRRAGRSPWCGKCDERTRLLGFDGDAPRPCPNCRPAVLCSHTWAVHAGSGTSLKACGGRAPHNGRMGA